MYRDIVSKLFYSSLGWDVGPSATYIASYPLTCDISALLRKLSWAGSIVGHLGGHFGVVFLCVLLCVTVVGGEGEGNTVVRGQVSGARLRSPHHQLHCRTARTGCCHTLSRSYTFLLVDGVDGCLQAQTYHLHQSGVVQPSSTPAITSNSATIHTNTD